MRTPISILLCACFALTALSVAGCNKPDAAKTDTAKTASLPPAEHSKTPAPPKAPTTPPSTAAGQATPVTTPASLPPTPPEAAAGNETDSGQVNQTDLTGRWLALFSSNGATGVKQAWQTGEILEFNSDGWLIWEGAPGGKGKTFRASLNGNDLELKPGDKMNVGRDDEVGLMNVGRDDEVGLNKAKPSGNGSKASAAEDAMHEQIYRDGNYLAFFSGPSAVTIYGKLDDAAPKAAPALQGAYVGNVAHERNIPATFSWDGKQLTVAFDNGKSSFKGEYFRGYFLGQTTGEQGTTPAALMVGPGGVLDGVLLPAPYDKVNASFDFTPSSK